jgi:hypothetical protein
LSKELKGSNESQTGMELRSLGTQSDTRTSSRRFVWFILGLLLVSSIGYAFLSIPASNAPAPSSQTGVYPEGTGWAADVYGAHLTFGTDPAFGKTLSYDLNFTLGELGAGPLYIANEQGLLQLSTSLGLLLPLQEVCLGSCTRDVPEKTCQGNEWVVTWHPHANVTSITQEGRCIILNGDARVVDAFAYKVLNLLA